MGSVAFYHNRLSQPLWMCANRLCFEREAGASSNISRLHPCSVWKRDQHLYIIHFQKHIHYSYPHILILLALLCHPPKYLCVSYQRPGDRLSCFVCARGNEELLWQWTITPHKIRSVRLLCRRPLSHLGSRCRWTSSVCVDGQQRHTRRNTPRSTCVGGVATQQLSGAAYGVSNWVEQHSWRTPVQILASSNQSHHHSHAPKPQQWMFLNSTERNHTIMVTKNMVVMQFYFRMKHWICVRVPDLQPVTIYWRWAQKWCSSLDVFIYSTWWQMQPRTVNEILNNSAFTLLLALYMYVTGESIP